MYLGGNGGLTGHAPAMGSSTRARFAIGSSAGGKDGLGKGDLDMMKWWTRILVDGAIVSGEERGRQ